MAARARHNLPLSNSMNAMSSTPKRYVAGLCRMTEHGLAPAYESAEIMASDDEQAKRKAKAWANTNAGIFTEHVFLLVLIDGKAIDSTPLTEGF